MRAEVLNNYGGYYQGNRQFLSQYTNGNKENHLADTQRIGEVYGDSHRYGYFFGFVFRPCRLRCDTVIEVDYFLIGGRYL